MHNIRDLKVLKKYKMIKPKRVYEINSLNNKVRKKIELKIRN